LLLFAKITVRFLILETY